MICGNRISPLSGPSPRKRKEEAQGTSTPQSGSFGQHLVHGELNQPALYLLGLIVVFDNFAMINVLSWLGVMAKDRFGASPIEVGILSSLMAMAVLIGRVVMAYFIMSFFMSAQAAATYAIGTEKLGERLAVGIPMIDGLGSLGSIVAPLVMGSLAIQVGLDRALWLVPAFGAMVSVVCLVWEWLDRSA